MALSQLSGLLRRTHTTLESSAIKSSVAKGLMPSKDKKRRGSVAVGANVTENLQQLSSMFM